MRLWRALGWTPEEVQLVLDIFTPTDSIQGGLGMGAALNRDTLARIADLVYLKDWLSCRSRSRRADFRESARPGEPEGRAWTAVCSEAARS